MMLIRYTLLLLLLPGCSTISAWSSREPSSVNSKFVVHSHRGAAHLPENMMTAFHCAAKMGADVIEMDLQITRDDKVIVAHDAYLKDECADRAGKPVTPKGVFFRDNTWEAIENYDCGSRTTKTSVMPVSGEGISSLEHVLESLRRVKTATGKPVGFNIEIKYNPSQPQFYPLRAFYAKHIMSVIADSGIAESRLLIQSFDIGILEEIRKLHPTIRLSPLIGDDYAFSHALEYAKLLNTDLITPHYKFVNKEMVDTFHSHKIQVIPWTVNDPKVKKQMVDAGVDGVITDNLRLFRPAASQTCP